MHVIECISATFLKERNYNFTIETNGSKAFQGGLKRFGFLRKMAAQGGITTTYKQILSCFFLSNNIERSGDLSMDSNGLFTRKTA